MDVNLSKVKIEILIKTNVPTTPPPFSHFNLKSKGLYSLPKLVTSLVILEKGYYSFHLIIVLNHNKLMFYVYDN